MTQNELTRKDEMLPALGNHQLWFKNELSRVVWAGLSAPETKALSVVLSTYYEDLKRDPAAQATVISFDEMRHRLNYQRNRVNIVNYIKSIRNKLMGWHEFTLGSVETSFVLIPTINIDRKNKFFRFVFNPDLTRLLLFDETQGGFVRYPERTIINLDSVTSMTLYRLLKGFRTTGKAIFTKNGQPGKRKGDPDRPGLWDLLEVKPTMRESDFNKRYLKPAMIDLAPYFNGLGFEKKYGTVKGHKSVVGYVFTFTPEAPDQDENLVGDKLMQHKTIGLKNIRSAKCLTETERFKAVDKFLKQKLGTAKKDAKMGINVFNADPVPYFFESDPAPALPNIYLKNKKLKEKVEKASLAELEQMERQLTKKMTTKGAKNSSQDEINDLLAIRRTIFQQKKQKHK